MVIGYARTSTRDQKIQNQRETLLAHGCEKIFEDQLSGRDTKRPELQEMLKMLREGDTVVVTKLDRLGRSLKDLITLVDGFGKQGVNFVSLNDAIDTTTPSGRLMFNVIGSIAEFERELIGERINDGIEQARSRGVKLGRPRGRSEKASAKALAARKIIKSGGTVSEAARAMGVSRMTIYRWMEREK